MKITSTIAANSMRTSIKRMAVVTNNIANATTNSYKKRYSSVANGTLYGTVNANKGIQTQTKPTNIGANFSKINISEEQGNIIYTGNEADFAIEGEGYFGVSDPDTGELVLTRNGEFTLFADGVFRDRHNRELHVDPLVNDASGFNFVLYSVDPDKLNPIGKNFFSVSDEAVIKTNLTNPEMFDTVKQYSVETSNVHLPDEFISLMEIQNVHSMSSRIFQIDDEIVESLNHLEK